MSALKLQIQDDMKAAMRSGEKDRLSTIRLIMAAIKQLEVDGQKELDDAATLAVLDKMVKQRRESIRQFEEADRVDLVEKENSELEVIASYLPEQLGEEEITALVEEVIAATGASSMKDMGKVMGQLKPKLQGRADMSQVSGMIKAKLS